jgi:ATP phosphoribosyltransferase regulatory subunit
MQQCIDARDGAALEQLLSRFVKSMPAVSRAVQLARLSGGAEVLGEARKLVSNAQSRAAIGLLELLCEGVESLGLSECFSIDLSDVSGLDYYTGLVFKIYIEGAGARVGSGGRYDELTANFGRREPAIGFVLDLDAVTEIIARGGDFEPENGGSDTATIIKSGYLEERFREAKSKRERGEKIRME